MNRLTVAPCDYRAAKHAVERWHYSQTMPCAKLVKLGVWENGAFVGVIIFSHGATNTLLKQWGYSTTDGCELTRVALKQHDAPVSQILAIAIRYLRRTNPNLRIIVSFADPVQGHHGGIYQAGNWLYSGTSSPSTEFIVHGVQMHMRSVHARGWRQTIEWIREHVDDDARKVVVPGKHRYIMPLDKQARRKMLKVVKEYPSAHV